MTKLKTLSREQQDLIIKNLDWAENIAKKYTLIAKNKGMSKDEVLSSAFFGLCEAAGKYNFEKGKFTTFSYTYVVGQILRDINKVRGYENLDDCENVLYNTDVEDSDERYVKVQNALEALSPREKKVVCWKFGMSEEPLDMLTIAKVMHLSPKKVKDIYKSAVKKMKQCA